MHTNIAHSAQRTPTHTRTYKHTHTSLVDLAAGCVTHGVRVNIGEQRGLLVEAAKDQLADHQGEVEVEGGESQLVAHFALK